MKIKPKAPWYVDSGISANGLRADKVETALGLCKGCIHLRVNVDPQDPCRINITCAHHKRQGPGLGLSTTEKCPYYLKVVSKNPELKKLYETPLEMCPDCSGTGNWKGGISPESESRPCPRCFGTGALTPLG